jgi:hypothetical protein
LKTPIWVQIDRLGEKWDLNESIKNRKIEIKNSILSSIAREKGIEEILIPLFIKVYFNKSIKEFDGNSKILETLDRHFSGVKNQNKGEEFSIPSDLENRDNTWYNKVFGLAKKYDIKLPDFNGTNKELKKYALQNKEAFLVFLKQIQSNTELKKCEDYKKSIEE